MAKVLHLRGIDSVSGLSTSLDYCLRFLSAFVGIAYETLDERRVPLRREERAKLITLANYLSSREAAIPRQTILGFMRDGMNGIDAFLACYEVYDQSGQSIGEISEQVRSVLENAVGRGR